MRSRKLLLTAWVFLFCSVAGLCYAQSVVIDQLKGHVTEKNFEQFESFISGSLDKIVELKIYFDQSRQDDKLQAYEANGRFVTYLRNQDAGSEMVANRGYRFEHGGYVFDGFFLIKSGGMHQGILSYGLQLIDETTVRLNPHVKISPSTLR